MTDPTPATPPADGVTPDAPPDDASQGAQPQFTAEDREKLQTALSAEREARKAAEKAARASMTEAERNTAEAEERGAARVRSQYGQRLAQTEFRAAAATRNSSFDVAKALAYVDMSKFVGDDGEPDAKAIAAAVADLVPEATNGTPTPPSFDGGTRQPAPAGVSMTGLIRKAAGRA